MADWLPERLPEDIESERSLLSTLCAPGAERVAEELRFQLQDEDFVHPSHRFIFRAMCDVLDDQMEMNPLTLKNALEHAGALGKIGGYPGLIEVLGGVEVGRPRILADILQAKRKHRQLIRIGANLVREASVESSSPDALIEQASAEMTKLVRAKAQAKLELVGDHIDETIAKIVDRVEGRSTVGVKVGFSRLDNMTQGFQPGNLIVLAARPGIGKTSLALDWLLRSAKAGNPGAFFSLEMSRDEVNERMIAAWGRVNMKMVEATRDRNLLEKVYGAAAAIRELPIHVSDVGQITAREIRAEAERAMVATRGELKLLIVDYLQLISSPQDSRSSKQSEAVRIGEISRELKLLAKDHGLPVVVLSQLNREVEHRENGRPRLSDLRDSGCIEQDADMVMFLHRRNLPAEDQQDAADGSTELLIAKHRNGPLGIIPLQFDGEFTSYREIVRYTDPAPSEPEPYQQELELEDPF